MKTEFVFLIDLGWLSNNSFPKKEWPSGIPIQPFRKNANNQMGRFATMIIGLDPNWKIPFLQL